MYHEIMKSRVALVVVIVLAVVISFQATSIDEDMLNAKISTPTILITKALIEFSLLVITYIFVSPIRSKIRSDFNKISLISVLLLGLYTVLGLGLAFIANKALLHHGTNEVKMYELIVGVLVTGIIYFSNSKEKATPKKILFFIMLAVFAILFMNE